MITPRTLITTIALLIAITGCQNKTETNDENGSPNPAIRTAKPGIRTSYIDSTVSPKEDFYRFANGTYLKETPMPDKYGRWGAFNELRELADARLRAILEASAKKKNGTAEEKKLGDLWETGMDSETIEKKGLKDIQFLMDKVDKISTGTELVETIATLHTYGISAGFRANVGMDAKNSERMILNFSQGGTGMRDRDYYLKPDREKIRTGYKVFMEKLLSLIGTPAPAEAVETIMEMETEMARNALTLVERRNPDSVYHLMKLTEIATQIPAFDWEKYVKTIGLEGLEEANLRMPRFFKAFAEMGAKYDMGTWKTYLKWNIIRTLSPYLGKEFVDASFDFYSTTMQGVTEQLPRWQRVATHIDQHMGMALGRIYVKKHFTENARAIAQNMVKNILAVMKERLGQLEWMGDETRALAVEKLEKITPKIGYPDKWRNYDGLKTDRKSYVGNILAARNFNFNFRLSKLNQPVDKTEWLTPPQTVNAYYNPQKNEIVFPAGILQAPFFDERADEAVNYGAFGAVIGHELIHAYDDQGSRYDAVGNLNNWWTKEDRENFTTRTDLVVRQYNACTVQDSLNVNGKLTLGENIADIDGLRMSYMALTKSLSNKRVGLIDGYGPSQRFFLSWAQIWATLYKPEAARMQVLTDPHSPSQYRVNVPVSNNPAFYAAFEVGEGDPMYRSDTGRVQIW